MLPIEKSHVMMMMYRSHGHVGFSPSNENSIRSSKKPSKDNPPLQNDPTEKDEKEKERKA